MTKSEQCRVQSLLKDTITLLCRNSLRFTEELKVQGLLGITLDNNDIFIVHIDESFGVELNQPKDTDYDEDFRDSFIDIAHKKPREKKKGIHQGTSRMQHSGKMNDHANLHVNSTDQCEDVFATNDENFDGNCLRHDGSEVHNALVLSEDDDITCDVDTKSSMLIPVETNIADLSNSVKNVRCQLTKTGSSHLQERHWVTGRSHEAGLTPNTIKQETGTSVESEGEEQFMHNQNNMPIVIQDVTSLTEMDKLFVSEADELGYMGSVPRTQDYVQQSMLGVAGYPQANGQPLTASTSYGFASHHISTVTPQSQSRTSRSIGKSGYVSGNIWKNSKKPQKSHKYQPNALVVTKSFHICGYPDCGKQFYHRRHLLRHQTQKHGRVPTRVLNNSKRMSWTSFHSVEGGSDINVKDFIDSCTNSMTE